MDLFSFTAGALISVICLKMLQKYFPSVKEGFTEVANIPSRIDQLEQTIKKLEDIAPPDTNGKYYYLDRFGADDRTLASRMLGR